MLEGERVYAQAFTYASDHGFVLIAVRIAEIYGVRAFSPHVVLLIRREIRSVTLFEREKFRKLHGYSSGGHAMRICTAFASRGSHPARLVPELVSHVR